MKRILSQVGIALLVAFLASCGAGFALSRDGDSTALLVLRDLSVIVLALLSLVGTVTAAAVYFGSTWAVDRFGAKAIAGVHWVGRKTYRAETVVEKVMDRFAVRPLAKATRAITSAGSFASASARRGPRVDALVAQRATVVRSVNGLLRQIRGNPIGAADR